MESIWRDTAAIPTFPRLDHDLKTDVLIVGGGLAGVLCACFLEQDGVNYALIESDRIFNGVSGFTTAKITVQHGLIYEKLIRRYGVEAAQIYYQANAAALADYRRLCSGIGCDFETADAYVYSVDRRKKLEKELSAQERIGCPAEFVRDLPLPFPTEGGIRITDQAQFHPLKFAAEISRGLHIYEHTAAREFVGNTVLTDHGRIQASKIIIATHFPVINKHGSYFLKLYQHRSYVLALSNGQNVNGMYMDERKTGLSFRNYQNLLILGGGAHRTGKPGGDWEPLSTFSKTHYPAAIEKYRWATQDCMSLDGIPYIGQYSKHTPDLYVATGFNKWGMTSSMVAAGILRDLVQGRENAYAAVFSPSRTILHPQLACNAAEAVAHLVTPTRPRCPHMGCALKWNPQEHTWDCPCHGSRFGKDGKLLNNPATDDLNCHE